MKLQSKSGFSLVELMVVVAIIGILATIAVPNFQRFQARAKQASAKTELTGLYTAQKAFYVEYNSYTADLQLAGFVPEGISLDNVANVTAAEVLDMKRIYGSSMGTVPAQADIAGTDPVAASKFPGFPAAHTAIFSFDEMGLTRSTDYAGTGAYPAHDKACALVNAAAAANIRGALNTFTPGASREAFLAVTRGCPKGSASVAATADLDDWAISHNRQLVNVRNGI